MLNTFCDSPDPKRDTVRDMVPFVQFKKHEKHPWRSVNFCKINTPPWVFFTFFKLYKWYQIAQRITNVTHNIFQALTICTKFGKGLDTSFFFSPLAHPPT